MATPRIDCLRCIYYFVTWDPFAPHGCRQMGFKSRLQPSEEVRRVMSGRECLSFQANARRVGPAVASVDDYGAKALLKKAES